jgi:hypothetical protein
MQEQQQKQVRKETDAEITYIKQCAGSPGL